jgi:hypothetical protein
VAEIQIRFRMNLKTGKKDILIDYESDEDAMRHEHERDHKRIVQQLIGQGLIAEEEVGDVQVTREAPGQAAERPQQEPPRPEGLAQGS